MIVESIKMPSLDDVAIAAALTMREWEAMGRLCASVEDDSHGARELSRKLERDPRHPGAWEPYVLRDEVETYVRGKMEDEGIAVGDWFISATIDCDQANPEGFGRWVVRLWCRRRTSNAPAGVHNPTISEKMRYGDTLKGNLDCDHVGHARGGDHGVICTNCGRDAEEPRRRVFWPGEVEVEYFRASGNVNDDGVAVRLEHTPTGIVVQATAGRTRCENEAQAYAELRGELSKRGLDEISPKIRETPHASSPGICETPAVGALRVETLEGSDRKLKVPEELRWDPKNPVEAVGEPSEAEIEALMERRKELRAPFAVNKPVIQSGSTDMLTVPDDCPIIPGVPTRKAYYIDIGKTPDKEEPEDES